LTQKGVPRGNRMTRSNISPTVFDKAQGKKSPTDGGGANCGIEGVGASTANCKKRGNVGNKVEG